MKSILLIFVVLATLTTVSSQEITMEKIEVEDNNQVHKNFKILIDKNNILWYTINGGLMQHYGEKQIYHPLFSGEDIFFSSYGLIESHDRLIYLTTEKGVFIYNPKNGKTNKIEPPKKNGKEIVLEYPTKDDNDNIWFLTKATNKIYKYDSQKKLSEYRFIQRDSTIFYKYLFSFFNSDVLLNTTFDIQKLDEKKKTFSTVYTFTKKENTQNILVKNGRFFKPNTSGKHKINGVLYDYKYLSDINAQIIEFPCEYYFPLDGTNNIIDNEKLNLLTINSNILKFFSFNRRANSFILKKTTPLSSRVGQLRIGSNNDIYLSKSGAIYKLKYSEKEIQKFLYSNEKNKLEKSIRGITVNKTTMIAVYDSIITKSYNKANKNFIPYHKFEKTPTGFWRVHRENDSLLWVVGENNYLLKFNEKNNSHVRYKFPVKNFSKIQDVFCEAIHPYKKDKLLLGGNFPLQVFDKKTESFTNYGVKFNLPDLYVNDIFIEKESIWVATKNRGIFCFNEKTGKQINYSTNSKVKLTSNYVYDIHLAKNNHLYIGTNEGLNILNLNTNSIEYLNSERVLPDKRIVSILETNEDLWLGSWNGLIRLNKENKKISKYFEEDGLPSNEFNRASFYNYNDSLLVFGGINGIAVFNPNKVPRKEKSSKIKLLKKTTHNNSTIYNLDNIYKIPISYDKNFVSLSFSNVADLTDKIYYRIKEFDSDWILANNNNVDLNALPEGNFNLNVTSGNALSNNSLSYKEYKVIVTKVFYERKWFQFMVLTLILSTLFFVLKSRQKKEYKLQLKIRDLDDQAYRAQMNPHFTFNIINSIQSVFLLKGEESVNDYISSFASLLRLTLEISRKKDILLSKEIRYLKTFLKLHELRTDLNIDYKFHLDSKLDPNLVKIPSMFFQPIVENALEHGLKHKNGEKKLDISFTLVDNTLLCEIEDNGIGYAKSKEINRGKKSQKSYGNEILMERIHIYNETNSSKIKYRIENLPNNSGTKVILSIPYK